MLDVIYSLCAHSWSGLAIAVAVGALGCVIVYGATRRRWRGARVAGLVICVGAVLLAIGSAVAIVRIGEAERRYPIMGRLVDVGGYRMNILAEGDAHGGPTVIWIPGSHGPGITMYHLHQVMRNETRSILFDRPGTGWSDTGPFPRTTAREAEELATLLDHAGERGPFILVGHSYGGLLALNYARRHPERTAAVVSLDSTPPDVFEYLLGWTPGTQAAAWYQRLGWVKKLLGLNRETPRKNAPIGRAERAYEESLADVRGPLTAFNANPASDLASASIMSEWSDPKSVWNLLVYDGELGDLPVYNVTPGDNDPKDVQRQLGLSGDQLARVVNFLQHARMHYLAASTNAVWIRTPAGTDHNFPYETPAFVLDLVRRVLVTTRRH